MTIEYSDDDALMHYGVLGMKWGRRKDGKPQGFQYGKNQKRRDQEIYGKRGARRINRKLKKGTNIATARSIEKTKRDKTIQRARTVRAVGEKVEPYAGAVGAVLAGKAIRAGVTSRTGQKALLNVLRVTKSVKAVRAVNVGSAWLTSKEGMTVLAGMGFAAGTFSSGRASRNQYVRSKGYKPARTK